MDKKAIVMGAGGFIGSHMVKRLKKEGYYVKGVDLKNPEFSNTEADDFIIGDLRDPKLVADIIDSDYDELYQFAADMGGAGYIFTGENDANVMHNSAIINLNVADECVKKGVKKVFYSSSACMYPAYNQEDPDNPKCNEDSAYPAMPDSEYGWEKLFSERLYFAFNRNYKLNVRIARFHNIFGSFGTWRGGKEKAPAAMLRKVVECPDGGQIEVWGDGLQTRSFLHVSECIEAVLRLMNSSFMGPVNIGSEEMVTINQLAQMAINISGKKIKIKNIEGNEFYEKYGFNCPTGVRGRNSENSLFRKMMGWEVSEPLFDGMKKTYEWIKVEYEKNNK